MRAKKQQKMQPLPEPTLSVTTRQQKISLFLQKAQNSIAEMIDNDKIKIPKQKIPFIINKTSGQSEILGERIKKIQINKQIMQSRLKSISEEYRGLQKKHREVQRKVGQSPVSDRMDNSTLIKQKSQLKAEDIVLLKKLKKQYREFQHNLQLKTKAYEDSMALMKKEQQQLLQHKIKEENQTKRKQIAKKLQSLALKKKEKEKNFEEQKKKMLEIKTKKKLYEQLQEKQRSLEKQQMEKRVEEMQERFQGRQVNYDDLRDHEQKYREIKQKWREERQRKLQQYEQIQRQRKQQIKSCEKSKYYTIVLKQKKIEKAQQQKKLKKKMQLIQTSKEYAQKVKRQHIPKVKTKQSEQDQKKNKVETLTFQQQKQIGNNYMQYVKKMLKKRSNNKTTLSNKANTEFINKNTRSELSNKDLTVKVDSTTNSMKYHDYLSERRTNRVVINDRNHTSGFGKEIKNSFIRRQLEDVYKVMQSTCNKSEKLEQIKYITKKIQQKDNKEDYMLDKISAKLKILDTLSDYQ